MNLPPIIRHAQRLGIVFTLATCAATPAAHAHGNVLRSTTPADGSTVTTPIQSVVATYATAPLPSGRITIDEPDGTPESVTGSVQGTRYVIPVVPDQAGTWRVSWSMKNTDGHVVEYEISFIVTESAVGGSDDGGSSGIGSLWSWLLSLFG